MSVIISARGTVHSSFRVGLSGVLVDENGVFTMPTNSDMTVNLPSDKSLVINSGSGVSVIRSDSPSINIVSNQLKLNSTVWPVNDGAPGQVIQTDGMGNLSWITVTSGGGTPTFDIQLANTVLAAPIGTNGIPTFRRLTPSDIPILNQDTTGNAATATRLSLTSDIGITGDATWSVSFDGASSVSSDIVLSNTGVTAGTYTKITVDSKGRVTSGASPSTLSGYGITDAATLGTVQSFTASKTFLETTYFGLANRGQAGSASVISYSSGTNPALSVAPKASVLGSTGNFSFYGTLGTGVNYTPQRVADVWAGFDGDAWGTEYIAWGVGSGTSGVNDTGARTTERMRLTKQGLVCTGDISITSDERLKTDWCNLDKDVIQKIANVTSGVYKRMDTGAVQVGVSAQSLYDVIPEAVRIDNDTYSVSYGNAALALCVELAKKIIELEERLNGIAK